MPRTQTRIALLEFFRSAPPAGCAESGSSELNSVSPASLSNEVVSREGMRAQPLQRDEAARLQEFSGDTTNGEASITTCWHPGAEPCLNVTTLQGRDRD